MSDRATRQLRTIDAQFTTREDSGDLHISGYFAVFNSNYDITQGMSESIAPGAFRNTLGGDIRALVNHDTTLVLGRNTAHTLELREDEHGLWGDILINPNDQDAMNLRARVDRGDVTQCSIGFDILSEETDFRDDGSVHWTITEVKLYEVSCCTFPAYEETNISARERDKAEIQRRSLQKRKEELQRKLKGDLSDGT